MICSYKSFNVSRVPAVEWQHDHPLWSEVELPCPSGFAAVHPVPNAPTSSQLPPLRPLDATRERSSVRPCCGEAWTPNRAIGPHRASTRPPVGVLHRSSLPAESEFPRHSAYTATGKSHRGRWGSEPSPDTSASTARRSSPFDRYENVQWNHRAGRRPIVPHRPNREDRDGQIERSDQQFRPADVPSSIAFPVSVGHRRLQSDFAIGQYDHGCR